MDKKYSFDSTCSNNFSEHDIDDAETKEHTQKGREDEDDQKEFQNIELIKAISQTLETILEDNKLNPNYEDIVRKQSKSVFSASSIPSISIEDYLIRIQTYSNIEKNTLIAGLIFIDRLCKISNLTLTYYNIHRILFTAILLSIKYNEDTFYDNVFYSEIAGVKLKELKSLEYDFVKKINFCFFIKDEIFEKYKISLDNFEQ